MRFLARVCVLLVVVASVGVPTARASADPPPLSCTEDFAPGEVVVLDQDLSCDRMSWQAREVSIDLNGHTIMVMEDHPFCGYEESVCDIEMDSGELKNGRLVGTDLVYGTVHDVEIDGSRLVEVDGYDNVIENSGLMWGGVHRRTIFVDSVLWDISKFDHNLLVRSRAYADNYAQGIHYDVTDNWMIDSKIAASVYPFSGPDDLRGAIARNLIQRGSINISGALGDSMGSMSITDNVIIRAASDAIRVENEDPPPCPGCEPDSGGGGPLTVARNTIYFSPISIWVNSPFIFGDLSGNRNIISGPCIGVACSRQ